MAWLVRFLSGGVADVEAGRGRYLAQAAVLGVGFFVLGNYQLAHLLGSSAGGGNAYVGEGDIFRIQAGDTRDGAAHHTFADGGHSAYADALHPASAGIIRFAASSHTYEDGRLDIPHRDIADIYILADAAVNHLYGYAGDDRYRGADAGELGGPVAEVVLAGSADGNVADGDVAVSDVGSCAQLDGVAVGRGDAVAYADILAETLARALQADGVILAVEDAVFHYHVLGFYVYAVVIVVAVGIDLDAADAYSLAVRVVLHPVRGIFETDVAHDYVLALTEKDDHRPSARICLAYVECRVAALSVDGAESGDGDVLLIICIDQGRVRGPFAFGTDVVSLFVCLDIGDPEQSGTHIQVELHAGLEFYGPRQELSCGDGDGASALGAEFVDGLLDNGRIIFYQAGLCSGLGNDNVAVARKCGQGYKQ